MLLTRGVAKTKGFFFIAKSDNINALRKQYDAFLEEDQKRKKRNEYILGKLDKMRSSTALVPVRLKAYTPDHRLLEVHDVGYQPENSFNHDFQPSIANRKHIIPIIETNTDDSMLIQEISKKYILIPKLRSSFINNGISTVIPNHNTERLLNVQNFPNKGISPNTDESTDWKSKYDILNVLKNEEKETLKFNTQVEGMPKSNVNEDSLMRNNYQQVANDYTKIKTDIEDVETSNKFLDELPEKDFYNATINYESNDNINEYNSGNINSISNKIAVTANTYDDPTGIINDKLQNITLQYNNSDASNTTLTLNASAKGEKTQPEDNVNVSSTDADFLEASQNVKLNHVENNSVLNNQNISKEQQQHEPEDLGQVFNLDNQNISPMQAMSNQEVMDNINNTPSQEQENISSEVENVQKSIPDDVEIKTNINEREDVEIQDNIQPTYEYDNDSQPVVAENLNIVDVSGSIEDFNAEQMEMFYSENNDSTDPPEDSKPENSDHLHNLEFDYYEGVPSDVYPVEINDQEELTHKFDPTYEQQYLNADVGLEQQPYEAQQQYEQQQNYDQHQYEQPQYDQQQYEQPEYDQQQYEQQQYEQQPQMQQEPESYNQPQPELDLQINEHQMSESNQRVEQMLDVEDGFVGQKEPLTETFERHVSEAPERQHKEAVGVEKAQPREEIQASEQVIG